MKKRVRGWLVVVVILLGIGGAGLSLAVKRERARSFPIQVFRVADLGEKDRLTIDEKNDRNHNWRRFEIQGTVPLRATLQQGVAGEVAIALSLDDVAALEQDVERHRTGAADSACAPKTRLRLLWEFEGQDKVPEDTHWACGTNAINSIYVRGAALVSERVLARRKAREADERSRDAAVAVPDEVGAEGQGTPRSEVPRDAPSLKHGPVPASP